MNPTLHARHERLRSLLAERELDAFVVLDRSNAHYFTRFRSTYSILVIDGGRATLITDARYGEMAESALPGFDIVVQPTTGSQEFLRAWFRKRGYRRIGHETSITVGELESLRGYTRPARLVRAHDLPMALRRVKDAEELRHIRKAVRLADRMMEAAMALLVTGADERTISRRIRFLSEELGGEGESFPNIVASGRNSSRPHHQPGRRKLRAGDPVTIDLGAIVDGYCSDLTRTPVLGRVSRRFEKIYEVCLGANQAAIKAIRPGLTGREVDAVAREFIATAGYGEYFGHGLGHGVGIDIHEEPRLSPRANDYRLEAGNVVTIEPGIYIPGFGGVRIEDYLVLEPNGARILSRAPKSLAVLPAGASTT